VIVRWPGFEVPSKKIVNKDIFDKEFFSNYSFVGIVPISDTRAPYKNIKFIETINSKLKELNAALIITSEHFPTIHSNIYTLGRVSREDIFSLYSEVDFMLFTSKVETLGLPIFEFCQTGKPIYAYKAEYIVDLCEKFDSQTNIHLLDESDFTLLNKATISRLELGIENFSLSDWDIRELLDES
jgi:glycosyltransferase involved in cell wall biosynthesis